LILVSYIGQVVGSAAADAEGGAMAHPNEELVRRGFEAFSKGDVDTLRELFGPDAVWHAPGRSPLSGDHRGVDDILGFFARTLELTAGTFRVELHDVVANDEHAVALYVARGEREGRTLEDRSVLVSHVRNGKLLETWQHSEDQYAADEFLS
jgi:ketosteroid isomerase-like protein